MVKMVTDRETGDEWACKIMTLPTDGHTAGDGESTRDDIFKEIDIIMSLRHSNIIFMKEYFEETGRVYVIMEYLGGGELLDALLKKEKKNDGTEAHYSEDDARIIFRQLIEGVKYMHDKCVRVMLTDCGAYNLCCLWSVFLDSHLILYVLMSAGRSFTEI